MCWTTFAFDAHWKPKGNVLLQKLLMVYQLWFQCADVGCGPLLMPAWSETCPSHSLGTCGLKFRAFYINKVLQMKNAGLQQQQQFPFPVLYLISWITESAAAWVCVWCISLSACLCVGLQSVFCATGSVCSCLSFEVLRQMGDQTTQKKPIW